MMWWVTDDVLMFLLSHYNYPHYVSVSSVGTAQFRPHCRGAGSSPGASSRVSPALILFLPPVKMSNNYKTASSWGVIVSEAGGCSERTELRGQQRAESPAVRRRRRRRRRSSSRRRRRSSPCESSSMSPPGGKINRPKTVRNSDLYLTCGWKHRTGRTEASTSCCHLYYTGNNEHRAGLLAASMES